MSTEWDMIVVFECTELTLGEWEALSTRLRNNKNKTLGRHIEYQQLGGDANPDHPTHWLRQRIDAGQTKEYVSRHEDNPTLFDPITGEVTELGAAYIAKLDNLTGLRKERLRYGRWAAAEGIVYEDWRRDLHLIDRFDPPPEWPRYWVVDFGFTHPFVWQCWVKDGDGRLYLWKEIYRTGMVVAEHARAIHAWREKIKDRAPSRIICDPADADGRAVLSRTLSELGEVATHTISAHKSVTRGIQQVQQRLQVAGDGKPRLFIMRDSRIHPPDNALVEGRKPTCTAEEVEGYIWQPNLQAKHEAPLKRDDHGMDALRYLVAEVDLVGDVTYGPDIWE